MTDSTEVDRGGKRERLVVSAGELMHHQGVPVTTLAQVAEAADVPVGNVYYYFKTKDDLIRAVIEAQATGVRNMLAALDQRRSPASRLKALARHWSDMRDVVARHGCPVGTLCTELGRRSDGLDEESVQLFRLIVEWAEAQFRQLGRRDAHDAAVTLLAGVQGAAQLSHAFSDPDIMAGQVRGLERWIDSMSPG
jgi:TetR/AcrR family transcriptional regulator, transcriptional repressor for nem operon